MQTIAFFARFGLINRVGESACSRCDERWNQTKTGADHAGSDGAGLAAMAAGKLAVRTVAVWAIAVGWAAVGTPSLGERVAR